MENTKIYNLDYLKEISAGDEDFFNHIIGDRCCRFCDKNVF